VKKLRQHVQSVDVRCAQLELLPEMLHEQIDAVMDETKLMNSRAR
jgi:hypothetical protein